MKKITVQTDLFVQWDLAYAHSEEEVAVPTKAVPAAPPLQCYWR